MFCKKNKKTKIIIRNIEEKDIPKVADIKIDSWRLTYKGIIDDNYLKSMDREQTIQKRKKDYKVGSFIVAEIDNEVVGFCRYYNEVISKDGDEYDCELMAIYVKPDLKGIGIGKSMFNYAIKDLKKQGKTKMILWCLKDNYQSRKFYERMGGTVVKEHDKKIGEKWYPVVGFGYDL